MLLNVLLLIGTIATTVLRDTETVKLAIKELRCLEPNILALDTTIKKITINDDPYPVLSAFRPLERKYRKLVGLTGDLVSGGDRPIDDQYRKIFLALETATAQLLVPLSRLLTGTAKFSMDFRLRIGNFLNALSAALNAVFENMDTIAPGGEKKALQDGEDEVDDDFAVLQKVYQPSKVDGN